MQVRAGVRSTGSRRGGFASAAMAVVLGMTLSACRHDTADHGDGVADGAADDADDRGDHAGR